MPTLSSAICKRIAGLAICSLAILTGTAQSKAELFKYGDITCRSDDKIDMGLIPAARSYYARNSKGKNVPVTEEGWDSKNATPTHIIVMASAASGEAYTGTIGLTFWIDNVATTY